VILRIDDTDVDRNTDVSLQSIYDGLNWLDLGWTRTTGNRTGWICIAPVRRRSSTRGPAYRDFTVRDDEADKSQGGWLFNPGMHELSPEESDRRAAAGEPFVLRYRVPRGTGRVIRFEDGVYGPQAKEADDVEDFALLRSNGMPTYHMASCADDADLAITNIIRGQDHLSNTFKHVLIFEALGVPAPDFAHLPLLIAPDGAKLSKRKHGPVVSVTTYRDAGFLAHTYVNFLCLLGWSPKDNREQMSRQELIDAFSLAGVNRANAVVNFTEADPLDPKAVWLNSQHLRAVPAAELAPLVRKVLEANGLQPNEPESAFFQTIEAARSRFATLNDFTERGRCYFSDDYPMAPDALAKLDAPQARELLRELAARIEGLAEFTEQTVEKELRDLATDKGVKAGYTTARARRSPTNGGSQRLRGLHGRRRERVIQRLKRYNSTAW
jgi:glutamyl-tRNA synthetase